MSVDPISVQEFQTRWELITDLFGELQKNGIDCAIPEPEEGYETVLEYIHDQGIDLADERELFLYMMGTCKIIEALWGGFQWGKTSREELVSVLNVIRNELSILRDFLPDAYFACFLA